MCTMSHVHHGLLVLLSGRLLVLLLHLLWLMRLLLLERMINWRGRQARVIKIIVVDVAVAVSVCVRVGSGGDDGSGVCVAQKRVVRCVVVAQVVCSWRRTSQACDRVFAIGNS